MVHFSLPKQPVVSQSMFENGQILFGHPVLENGTILCLTGRVLNKPQLNTFYDSLINNYKAF
jgi:hypothetical protein